MTSPQPPQAPLAERLLAGDKGALARLITWAENADARFADVMRALHPRVGRAWRVGVTGPPGAGKSTLVNEFARYERATKRSLGILAVDPSSPFTGGALLGDRIRMEERTTDPGIYIRSMASRGSHGGLARAAVDACDAMDAFGIEEILLETVGVGQAEYDIVAATDTVLVVLCPGAGDGIQAMKAGILEVADVLVVNKADLAGADRLVLDLEEAVHIREHTKKRPDGAWSVPVVAVSAGKGEHLDLLAGHVARHRAWLEEGRLAAVRRSKRLAHVRQVVEERLDEALWTRGGLAERAGALLDGGRAPYDVVETLVAAILAGDVSSRGAPKP
ncbi:MAG: methylmalonyl Co-A mutase-associated GTPase MeaB [Planctomycetes bacterium]|nr:methylmalonyl Co-A mutase-associated GTPase MeaB [Planctomycetota bacterium]